MQQDNTKAEPNQDGPQPDRRSLLLGGSAALAASMGALALGLPKPGSNPAGTGPAPQSNRPTSNAALNKAGWIVVGRLGG